MVSTGDTAPTFTTTVGTSDHEPFDLDEALGGGRVVLAFSPAQSRRPVRPR
jgi:peroxiredoxin